MLTAIFQVCCPRDCKQGVSFLLRREEGVRMDHLQDQDSEGEDDPTKLLDHWLGELNTLGKVSLLPGKV